MTDVKPWPASLTRLLRDLVETRAGERATSFQTEGGPPIVRPTNKSFPVLRGLAKLSALELDALKNTGRGKYEIEWKGQRKLVQLAPEAISPRNPREVSSEFVGGKTTYTIEFDLLLFT